MDVRRAAINTLLVWKKKTEVSGGPSPLLFADGSQAIRNEEGQGLFHQRWLLEQVRDGEVTGEKAHRWLAYAQGYLVRDTTLSLQECKFANLFA